MTPQFPNNKFCIVIDPSIEHDILLDHLKKFELFFRRKVDGVEFKIVVPNFLANKERFLILSNTYNFIELGPEEDTQLSTALTNFKNKIDYTNAYRKKLLRDKIASQVVMYSLLIKCDILFTNNKNLIKLQYDIYNDIFVKIVDYNKFDDAIDSILHGLSIFTNFSKEHVDAPNINTLYLFNDNKCNKFLTFYNKIRHNFPHSNATECLRAALLNRYPCILYCREMIKFYDFQKAKYERDSIEFNNSLLLAYHVNSYYFLLWGMFEQLTLLAKLHHNLEIDDFEIGIMNKHFWKKYKSVDDNLHKILHKFKIMDRIKIISEIRHSASHRFMHLPTDLLEKTQEHDLPEDIVVERILNDTDYTVEQKKLTRLKPFRDILIYKWRLKHTRKRAINQIPIRRKKGDPYLYNPVSSVDFELLYLNATIDAFLFSIFKQALEPTQ